MSWEEKWTEESKNAYWHKPDPKVVELLIKWREMGLSTAADIGCGIGRHALAMAEAGFSVTALDSSQTALDILDEASSRLGAKIHIVKGDYLKPLLPAQNFDVVISVNVLYHGSFGEFRLAVAIIREYLKPGGFLFLTCPTREDGKYGNGRKVAPHTYEPMNSVHPGDVHFFASVEDLEALMEGLEIISLDRDEHFWDNNGVRQFSSYWQVLARKQ